MATFDKTSCVSLGVQTGPVSHIPMRTERDPRKREHAYGIAKEGPECYFDRGLFESLKAKGIDARKAQSMSFRKRRGA